MITNHPVKKIFLLLTLVFSVVSVHVLGQKKGEPIDTLLERFDHKPGLKTAQAFFAYMDREEFMDEPVVFTSATPLDTMKALVWYWAGEWYYDEQEYALAEKNLLRALELMEYADEKSISDNLAMLGLTYMRQSKYNEALHYMRRCYQLDSKSGDPDRISSSLNTIAGTLLAAGNPKEAEERGVRQFGQGTEIVHRSDADLLAAEMIDRFGLVVTEVRVALERLNRGGVDRY